MSALIATARPSFTAGDNSAAMGLLPAAQLSTGRKVLALGIMCVGFFIAYLDIQIVAASLKEIGGGLSASQDEISWVQTSYLIAEIVVIPLSGWLSRVMSTRWLFAASAAGFTLASLLCASAWDIQSMIAFRALQGFLGGSMIPTLFTSAFIFFRGKQQPGTIVADTLPGHVFHGHVLSLAPATGAVFSVIPPENATGNFTKIVQRVPVRIALDDEDASLGRIRPVFPRSQP